MKRILNTVLAAAITLGAMTTIPVAELGTAMAQSTGGRGGGGGGGGGGSGGGGEGGDGDSLALFFRKDKPAVLPTNEFPEDKPPITLPKPPKRPRLVIVKFIQQCDGPVRPAFDPAGHKVGYYCQLRV